MNMQACRDKTDRCCYREASGAGQDAGRDRQREHDIGLTFGLRPHQGEHGHQYLDEAGGQQFQETVAGDHQMNHGSASRLMVI
jgi:hypothetical protein